jgi:hypothetical protein
MAQRSLYVVTKVYYRSMSCFAMISIGNCVDRVFGTVQWVHGRGSPWSTGFIKLWLLALGSTARIKLNEMIWGLLIQSVDRWTNGWPASPSVKTAWVKQSARECHDHRLQGAQARAMGHGARQGFSLRDLDDETNPFCILTVAEAVSGRLETVTRFGPLLAAASGSSDDKNWLRRLLTLPFCSSVLQ